MKHAAYGQVLLDLVKAFDRVPYQLLIDEAAHLGYSLWVLRLSIQAYRADRILRIDGAISERIQPVRGITAGSGLATTEMRLVMMRIVEKAWKIAPNVVPTLFVDDLSVEIAGSPKFVVRNIVAFTKSACSSISGKNGANSKLELGINVVAALLFVIGCK